MTNDRMQNLMQGALDEELNGQEQRELDALLASDPDQAEEFDGQKRVDDLLRFPPHERAPERLALTIMARIAESVQERQTASELTEAQMRVAIQLVTVTALPLLVAGGYMLLNAESDPEAFEAVLTQVAGLFILVTDTIQVMLEEAEAVYKEDPELAVAMLTMIPSTLLLLVQQIMGIDDNED